MPNAVIICLLAGSVEVAAVQATVHDLAVGYGAEVAAEVGTNALQLLMERKAHVGLTKPGRLKGEDPLEEHFTKSTAMQSMCKKECGASGSPAVTSSLVWSLCPRTEFEHGSGNGSIKNIVICVQRSGCIADNMRKLLEAACMTHQGAAPQHFVRLVLAAR